MSTEDLLRQRAQLLSAAPLKEETSDALDLIAFAVGREKYALRVDEIREIQPVVEVTPVPCVPDFVRGVVNLRGGILTLVDLHAFFGIQRPGMRDAARVVVLASSVLEVGLAVREVYDLVRVPVGSVLPPLSSPGGIDGRFLRGMLDDLTIILNAEAMLSDHRMIIDDSRALAARTQGEGG